MTLIAFFLSLVTLTTTTYLPATEGGRKDTTSEPLSKVGNRRRFFFEESLSIPNLR